MVAGAHVAFLIVAVILFVLSAIPPLRTFANVLMAVGLAFFAAAFLVS